MQTATTPRSDVVGDFTTSTDAELFARALELRNAGKPLGNSIIEKLLKGSIGNTERLWAHGRMIAEPRYDDGLYFRLRPVGRRAYDSIELCCQDEGRLFRDYDFLRNHPMFSPGRLVEVHGLLVPHWEKPFIQMDVIYFDRGLVVGPRLYTPEEQLIHSNKCADQRNEG